MKFACYCIISLLVNLFIFEPAIRAQSPSEKTGSNGRQVNTYVNPVLPGDHPDPTILKVGEDFYHCGSSFHFNPYLPIYHSKDLVHWEVIARVIPPSKANGWVADRPSAGIWQGAITYFYGSYRIYFSSGGQWFCKADSPYGPWSDAIRVNTNPATGPLGYDNSIFVDEDGKPYMLIKNGQKVNRIQALGKDGQLTDTVINLDWINDKLQYSWAEGPVMCKRNGNYYYFPAGDVSGGQYVLRSRELTADSTKWERLGAFFKPITDPATGFRHPNHISAPLQLADGTWWTVGQSYEKKDTDDWSGMGRQTSLYPVIWEGDRPWGIAPTTEPISRPDLPQGGIPWTSIRGDDFDSDVLGLQWHFINRKAAANYSLTQRKGWIRLSPGGAITHLVQKETDHYYTAVTRVELNAPDPASRAGIYLTNGNQKVEVKLYIDAGQPKKIIFRSDTAIRTAAYPFGNTVWLKIERKGHLLKGYYSSNGKTWLSLGLPVNSGNLDKTQPAFNSWVGTSVGLFAEGQPADFDLFVCKDAFSSILAAGFSNYSGVQKVPIENDQAVTTASPDQGWLMISGVETGKTPASAISVTAAAESAGIIEIYMDEMVKEKLLAILSITATGGKGRWKTFSRSIAGMSGHHDLFIRFPKAMDNRLFIKDLSFVRKN